MRIVRELGLEPSVDTLGRWLAHHLAEVILSVENAHGAEREAAQSKAVELILKVWSRRHDLPGRAHPLKDLQGVIEVLRLLRTDAWPYARGGTGDHERLLRKAFEGLQHIVAHAALLASGTIGKTIEVGEARDFVEGEEAKVLEALKAWSAFYDSAPRSPMVILMREDTSDLDAKKAEFEELLKLDPETRARKVFTAQLDRLIETLGELRTTLGTEGLEAPASVPES